MNKYKVSPFVRQMLLFLSRPLRNKEDKEKREKTVHKVLF